MRLNVWIACAGLSGLMAGAAQARVEGNSGYSKSQTFSAAVRLLRVDRGYEIVEKDADAAYLLFKYPVPGQKLVTDGSLEVVEARGAVRVIVTLSKLPEYHEALLRDALLKKLESELGPAPRPPEKPTKPVDKPGAGDKGGAEKRKKPEGPEPRPDDLED
ncbi:MAG TPA: hypothetical protein VFQ61_18710 [Polyangiaceae bacterium]|nr:hypothetical protein [Polyangiaceae bacterium]